MTGIPDDMTIVPDDKDWTVVLRSGCPECGYVPAATAAEDISATLAEMLPRWKSVLARTNAAVRPRPLTWSPLEYGAHVRDLFGVFQSRLQLMLCRDNPTFPDWDQDDAAVETRYGSQDPAAVSADLIVGGMAMCAELNRLTPAQWAAAGLRGDGAPFTVASLARYFLHDVGHHLHDVGG